MGKIIPTANNLGVSVDQLGAAYAIMTSKGIAAAESTTYLNNMYNELGKSGTKVSNALKESTGKSFAELTKEGKSTGDILKILDDYAKKSNLSLADLFGSAEAGKAALTLMSEGADGFNKSLEDMQNSTDATKKAFNEMNNTPTMKFQHAMAECKNAASDLGESFLPMVTSLAEVATQFMKTASAIARNNPELVSLVGKILAVVAAVGPLLMIVGKGIDTFLKMKSTIGMLKPVFRLLSGSIMSFVNTAITTLYVFIMDSVIPALSALWGVLMANPIILIITAITALVAAFIYCWNNVDGFKEWWINLWEAIKSAAQTAWDSVVTFFTEKIPEFFNNLVTWFQNLPETIAYWLGFALGKVISWAVNLAIEGYNAGSNFVQSAIDWIQQLPSRVWTWLTQTIANVATWAVEMYVKAINAGIQFVNGVINFIQTLPSRVGAWLSSTIQRVISWVQNMGQQARTAGSNFVSNCVNAIQSLPSKLWSIGSNAVQSLINGLKNGVGSLWSACTSLASKAVEGFKSALKIGSPSKVMRDEVGQWIPEGVTVGIKANAKDTFAAIEAFSNGIKSRISGKDFMGNVNLATSGININTDNDSNNLMLALGKLAQAVMDSRERIDYDKMSAAFTKGASAVDSTIVMDKTAVGRKTAQVVKERNEFLMNQQNRFRGDVDYV